MVANQGHIGCISNALYNLIMHHTNMCTFLKYYLSQQINKDLANIIHGLDPQKEIMRISYYISRTINPKQLQELTMV